MPLPWLTILKNVPWSTVIETAPTVADGAKKLWKSVSARVQSQDDSGNAAPAARHEADPARAAHEATAPPSTDRAAMQAIAALDTKLVAMQADLNELEHQLLASTELINTLADQNTLLIKRVEANRIRTVWLTRAGILLAVAAAAAGVALVLLR